MSLRIQDIRTQVTAQDSVTVTNLRGIPQYFRLYTEIVL